MAKIVTRIAPSPTNSFMHIGNLRTLLYNYFLAKRHGGKFIVRLEDTDRDRYTPSFLTYFKDTLDWLGIVPDASYWNPDPSIGSFIQSERDYTNKVKFLIDSGLAYYAYDSKEELDVLKSKGLKYDANTRMTMNNSLTNPDINPKCTSYVVRFAVTPGLDITFDDSILGTITINTDTLDDKVLIKSNGIGSYHLCNVCDDHDMGITHVLRGNEWVNSTPFHILLYNAFGWKAPIFAHLPLIMNPDGKGKLSKRTAAKYGIPIAPLGYSDADGKYVQGWKDLGFSPRAFINSLALIGWNPGNNVELMTIDDMINSFSLDRVNKSGARFDMDKAKWINSQWLKMTGNDLLKDHITLLDNRYDDKKINKIIDLAKDRSDFHQDLQKIVDLFFNHPKADGFKFDDNYLKVMSSFVDHIDNVNFDDLDDIKITIQSICDGFGIKMGKVMPGLRNSLVGGISGPDLMTTMSILGKEQTKFRISNSIQSLLQKTS